MSKSKNVKMSSWNSDGVKLTVSSKNIDSLKQFFSEYTAENSLFEDGDLAIEDHEDGLTIKCIAIGLEEFKSDLLAKLEDHPEWTPFVGHFYQASK